MNNVILKKATILGFSGVCAKSFDFILRGFYSRMLGAEGMGLLSLGFGIHGVMLTVATAGLGVATSKIVSEYIEKKDYGAVLKSMKISVSSVITLSLIILFITFIFAEWIARRILGDIRISTSICCLAPSILFMGVSYCLKGYFYATRKVAIPASSEFLEQAIKALMIFTMLKIFLPKGIEYGCTAVFIGITVGELSSCLYLTLFFIVDKKRLNRATTQNHIGKEIFKISFPSMLTSLSGSILRMQEEVIIISALKNFGMLHSDAMGYLGFIYGMVIPMLNFPLNLIGSVNTLLVPEISRANANSNKFRLKRIISKIYKIGIAFGISTLFIFQLYPKELSWLIYKNLSIVPYVRILSFIVPLMFIESLSCAILNGTGKQVTILFCSLSDSIIRIIGIIVLVSQKGLNGLLAVFILSNIYTCFITTKKVMGCCNSNKHLFSRLKIRNNEATL